MYRSRWQEDTEDMADFPTDFLWGSATAAHQVEGANTNSDWWAFELAEGTPAKEPSGDAIDHYTRFDSDFSLLAELGQNAHRFSLEWSRIEPTKGQFSVAGLDHYKRVLESLHSHGLTPFTTLQHFSLPQWFAQEGGWLSPDALGVFGRYVEHVADVLGDLMTYVGTVNEPSISSSSSYLAGTHPPGKKDIALAQRVNSTLADAHRTAVTAVRAGRGAPIVGVCLAVPYIEPLRPRDDADRETAAKLKAFLIDTHLDSLREADDPGDFVGVQYYARDRADATSPTMAAAPPADAEVSDLGWEVFPSGLGHVLREVAEVGLPVIVTENGIATRDDDQRVRYLASHLRELARTIDGGVDVRGYFHWSAFDNYEWGSFEPQFGLIGVDRANDMRRVIRPSAVHYGEVARTGSLAELEAAADRLTERRAADAT